MSSRENRPRSEMTQREFELLVSANPSWKTNDSSTHYTVQVKLRGLIWNKPVAYKQNGKYYKFDD